MSSMGWVILFLQLMVAVLQRLDAYLRRGA
ncbi:hypothetical protein QOY93_08825 [Leclercia adecarboxylata]|nr:hypothetical protein [Leclercia adecarboxylata]MDK4745459.1 hypothetical protein [Leclercia adecarboxylata]